MFRRPDGRTFTRDPSDVDDDVDVHASVDGELDDLLRRDVAGTDGWRWEPGHFREEIAGADPELDLVAAGYADIVRVWGTRVVGEAVELVRRIR